MLGSQGTLEKTEAPAAASTLACLGDNTRTQKCFRTANSQKLPGNQLDLQQRVLHRQGTCTDAAKSESTGTSYISKSSKLLDFSDGSKPCLRNQVGRDWRHKCALLCRKEQALGQCWLSPQHKTTVLGMVVFQTYRGFSMRASIQLLPFISLVVAITYSVPPSSNWERKRRAAISAKVTPPRKNINVTRFSPGWPKR